MNKRQKEVQQQFLDNEKAVLKKLEGNYQDALDEINSKIELLMARQDADMQHVIYQVEYQKALKTQVQSILETLQTNEFETVSEYLANSYHDGFIGTMYDLQGQGIPLVFPIDQEMVVAAVQHETKLSENLYTALGKDITDLRKKIAGEISRGISGGQMYAEITRNIASWANIPKNNAARIARTEAHRIQCKATADAQVRAKEKGADVVKQWDSSLDSKTRKSHRKLDGQIRELEEPFSVDGHKAMQPGGFGRPEEDINCRCALLQRARWALGNDYTKWSEDAEVIISDDGTTQFTIIEAKNYEEFQQKYTKAAEQIEKKASERVRQGEQKMNDDFVPAKTIEEAQEAAKQYIGNGYSKTFKNEADFRGVSVDTANEVNKAIMELYGQYNMPKLNGIKVISPTSAQGKKVFTDADAVAAYSPIEHGIFLNRDVLKNAKALEAYNKKAAEAWETVMQNIDKLSGSQKELALVYRNAGRALVGDGSVHDYIFHEMGHHVQWDVLDTATNNAMGSNMSKYAPGISGYANASKGEYIAESFVAYTKGEIERLDPEFVRYLNGKKVAGTLEKSVKSGTIELGNRKAYTKIKVEDIPSMNESKFLKIKEGLEKQGIAIIQDSEGDGFLEFMGAEAMTLSDGSAIIFQSGRIPSASAVYEEVIHTTQIKKNGMIESTGDIQGYIEYLNREIEANEKLIKYQSAYELTPEDVESVRENLKKYYADLKEVMENV